MMASLASATHGPLAIPLFRHLWLAVLVSQFGALIQSVGASWTMVAMGGSEVQIALVQASVTLPIMLLALIAGAAADSFEKRSIMLGAQIYMLALSFALALVAWFDLLEPWTLLAFTFLIGCGTAISGPSWQAAVGEIVPRQMIPSAVALNGMSFNLARSVGPAIGGVIVAAAGAFAAFAINVVSYFGLIFVLLSMPRQSAQDAQMREPIVAAVASGLRYVAMSPAIRTVLFRAMLFGLAAAGVPSLLPLVARDLLSGGALEFGLLSGAFGGGAVAGALVNARLGARLTNEQMVRWATLVTGAGAVVTAFSTQLAVAALGVFGTGAGWFLALACINVTVQMSVPRWVVGRALSLYQMSAFGAMAAGSWLFGAVAQHAGLTPSLCLAGGLCLGGVIAGLVRPMPEFGRVDLDPLDLWREPEVALPLNRHSGPIAISLHYRIAPDDNDAFLAVMAERRRVRIRDGARDWTLLRDVSDPDLWIERYRVATWQDYIRHNARRTKADVANLDAIRALHRGDWPPLVRRLLEQEPRGRDGNDIAPDAPIFDPLHDARH